MLKVNIALVGEPFKHTAKPRQELAFNVIVDHGLDAGGLRESGSSLDLPAV